MSSARMIATSGLTKRFGKVAAVTDLDLDVREGDVYGFLGPNGSGKTTTVRMLLGLVLATRGDIEVLGRPMPSSAPEVLPQVGAMIEGPGHAALLGTGERRALGRGGDRARVVAGVGAGTSRTPWNASA